MSRTIRRLLIVVLAVAAAAVPATAWAAPAACSTAWSSTPETAPRLGSAPTVEVRAGTHPCWDRVVFEVAGPAAGFTVKYVDEVTQDGSGAVMPVPGGARLLVNLNHPAYDGGGNSTLPGSPRAGDQVADVRGYPTLRSAVYAGSFEGNTTFGVGVRGRLPFRVFTLDGPDGGSRFVVDVAHRWS